MLWFVRRNDIEVCYKSVMETLFLSRYCTPPKGMYRSCDQFTWNSCSKMQNVLHLHLPQSGVSQNEILRELWRTCFTPFNGFNCNYTLQAYPSKVSRNFINITIIFLRNCNGNASPYKIHWGKKLLGQGGRQILCKHFGPTITTLKQVRTECAKELGRGEGAQAEARPLQKQSNGHNLERGETGNHFWSEGDKAPFYYPPGFLLEQVDRNKWLVIAQWSGCKYPLQPNLALSSRSNCRFRSSPSDEGKVTGSKAQAQVEGWHDNPPSNSAAVISQQHQWAVSSKKSAADVINEDSVLLQTRVWRRNI